MTLHNATENLKKLSIAGGIGLGCILVIVVVVRIGIVIKDIIFPPKVDPPTVAYNKLPFIQFPENATVENLTYQINTDTGELPGDFPDRLNVFPITHPEPNFLNLDNAKEKARTLGFANNEQVIPEVALGNGRYSWTEQKDMRRKLVMDTITFDFDLTSSFLIYLPILKGQNLTEDLAIKTVESTLTKINLFPDDIDLAKTQTPNNPERYVSYPHLFSIQNGKLTPATSLDKTQIIQVDLYQKNIKYDLDTGKTGGGERMEPVDYPIVYPHPPLSTMTFWVGDNNGMPEIVQAKHFHQIINFPQDVSASYPLKTVTQAFEELKSGEGYIAAYSGSDTQIFIKDVYLAYYLGETPQDYAVPVYVFEGEEGFFAYVFAVTNDWIE